MQEHHVLLRAVAHHITGADLLYTAAAMLSTGRNAAMRQHNQVICLMAARLLQLSVDPEVMERVLRDLPTRE